MNEEEIYHEIYINQMRIQILEYDLEEIQKEIKHREYKIKELEEELKEV